MPAATSAATSMSTATASPTARIPGTHPSKGGYFTRGTTKDRYARYTEEGPAYVDNMQRLLRKFETAKDAACRSPSSSAQRSRRRPASSGSAPPARRWPNRWPRSSADGIHLDRLRIRAFPFADAIAEFVAAHEHVFVVEQNRDAQLKMLLVNECGIDPAQADLGAALRRHADHRALHHARDRREGAAVQRPSLQLRRTEPRHDLPRQPKLHHPSLPKNALGYTRRDYEGAISTLCAGCGHDSISAAIIQAFFELDVAPHRVAKLSGIGCSSKTPTYFLGNSHGFNSVHGRMPSVLTGAALANRDLIYLGVSGDGDSASIGLGQFAHVLRRGVNMVYIVENNGVYGLTKGQFSATADKGSKSKRGAVNSDEPIDLVLLALTLGATFVARGFSGDKAQLVPLIKAAVEHRGAAFIDVVSPCVAFNNHAGSTKSYDYVREHNDAVNRLDFMPSREESPRNTRPATRARSCCTTAARSACASSTTSTIPPTRSRRWRTSSRAGRGRGGHRPAVPASGQRRHARRAGHGRRAAELAVRRRPRARQRRARRRQRKPALARFTAPDFLHIRFASASAVGLGVGSPILRSVLRSV